MGWEGEEQTGLLSMQQAEQQDTREMSAKCCPGWSPDWITLIDPQVSRQGCEGQEEEEEEEAVNLAARAQPHNYPLPGPTLTMRITRRASHCGLPMTLQPTEEKEVQARVQPSLSVRV